MKSLSLGILSLATVAALAGEAGAAQLYDFPFLGNDLKPGERYARSKSIHTEDPNHSQHFGYDLQARRYDSQNKRWTSVTVDPSTHWDNPKNSSYVIYGKPVYAIADAEVTKCWRNAPSNPRPKLPSEKKDEIDFADRQWLHSGLRQDRMHFGGNHLQMTLTDGKTIRYSHFTPGSIPAKLCPNNAQLYSTAGADSERNVPAGQRAKVKRGQFLGYVGNTGNSTGPHLHFHIQDGSNPSPITFRRGLSTPLNGDQANINSWTRFAGKKLPPGPILIWPARKLSSEYARHRVPAQDFQRLFDHLADSGYAPDWIDGYSVGGKTYYNFVWRPAQTQWRAYFGQTSSQYQQRVNQAKRDGLAPVQVESYLSNGNIQYAAIFKKVSGQWRARHDLTPAAHQAELNKAKQDKLQPINISVTSKNGARRYTVLYRKTNLGQWQVKSQLDNAAYQKAVDDNKKAGRKPFYINAYMHQGQPYFTAVFAEQPQGSWRARHNLTASGYQSTWQQALRDKLLTRVVSGYDGAQANHRFAALWRQ